MGGLSMPYSVTYDEINGIVCVTLSGLVRQSGHLAAYQEVMRTCRNKRCFRCLAKLADLNTASNVMRDFVELGKRAALTT